MEAEDFASARIPSLVGIGTRMGLETVNAAPYAPSPSGGFAQIFKIVRGIDGFISLKID
jgi:hypothetical protein